MDTTRPPRKKTVRRCSTCHKLVTDYKNIPLAQLKRLSALCAHQSQHSSFLFEQEESRTKTTRAQQLDGLLPSSCCESCKRSDKNKPQKQQQQKRRHNQTESEQEMREPPTKKNNEASSSLSSAAAPNSATSGSNTKNDNSSPRLVIKLPFLADLANNTVSKTTGKVRDGTVLEFDFANRGANISSSVSGNRVEYNNEDDDDDHEDVIDDDDDNDDDEDDDNVEEARSMVPPTRRNKRPLPRPAPSYGKSYAKSNRPTRIRSKPKNPLSAFFIFQNKKCKELKAKYPGILRREIQEELASRWREMDTKERDIWEDMATLDKNRFQQEWEEYRSKNDFKQKL